MKTAELSFVSRIFFLWVVLGAVSSAFAAVSEHSIYQELHPFFPRAQFRFFDKQYESVSAAAFKNEFLPDYSGYLQARGIHGADAGFSERQYAELCKSQMEVWLVHHYRYEYEAEAAVLVTDAQTRVANPRLPSGWLLVNLDGRWVVFDAGRFTMTPLESFRDRDAVAAVQF